jgi:DNA-directed RNA polymerase
MGKATVKLISVPKGGIMATLEEQIDLEYQMVQSGIDRYHKQLQDLLGKELGSKTKHGRTIIKGILDPVQEAIEEHCKVDKRYNRSTSKSLLKGMDAGKVAYLALVCLIDSLANNGTLLKVCRTIGIQIETQKRLDVWLQVDKEVATNMIKEANKKSDKGFLHKRYGLDHKINSDGVDLPTWTSQERINVGIKLVDLIITATGIVKLEKKIQKRKTIYHVVPTQETEEWIKAFNETNEVALPRYCPCIIEPKDWDSFWGGGYYSEHINNLPFVRVHA